MRTVAMLLDAAGRAVTVFADVDAANARRDRFNADPFLEPGKRDPGAPYTVEVWSVRASEEEAA